MIGHKEWMFDFDNSYRDSVKLGDYSRMEVMGKGNVKLYALIKLFMSLVMCILYLD
jgi:hypothetical protein